MASLARAFRAVPVGLHRTGLPALRGVPDGFGARPEEHTVTQALTSLGRERDWAACERFLERRCWQTSRPPGFHCALVTFTSHRRLKGVFFDGLLDAVAVGVQVEVDDHRGGRKGRARQERGFQRYPVHPQGSVEVAQQ